MILITYFTWGLLGFSSFINFKINTKEFLWLLHSDVFFLKVILSNLTSNFISLRVVVPEPVEKEPVSIKSPKWDGLHKKHFILRWIRRQGNTSKNVYCDTTWDLNVQKRIYIKGNVKRRTVVWRFVLVYGLKKKFILKAIFRLKSEILTHIFVIYDWITYTTNLK